MSQNAEKFDELGITPVLISADRPDASERVKQSYEIPFPLVSDPEMAASDAFDVARDVGEKERAKLEELGIDIEQWSGRDHHRIAMPAVFIVDEEGTVRWAHVSEDYEVRPSAEQLLEVARDWRRGEEQ